MKDTLIKQRGGGTEEGRGRERERKKDEDSLFSTKTEMQQFQKVVCMVINTT